MKSKRHGVDNSMVEEENLFIKLCEAFRYYVNAMGVICISIASIHREGASEGELLELKT